MIVARTPEKSQEVPTTRQKRRSDASSDRLCGYDHCQRVLRSKRQRYCSREHREWASAEGKKALLPLATCKRHGCRKQFRKRRADQEYCQKRCRKLAFEERKLQPVVELMKSLEQLLVHCEERQATTVGNTRLEVDILAARKLLEKLDDAAKCRI